MPQQHPHQHKGELLRQLAPDELAETEAILPLLEAASRDPSSRARLRTCTARPWPLPSEAEQRSVAEHNAAESSVTCLIVLRRQV